MQRLLSKLENINKYLVAAIILAIPLYPKFPLFSIPNTYVSVRLEDFLIALTLMIFLLTNLGDLRNFFKKKIFLVIALFLACGLLSYLSGLFVTQTISWKLGFLHWARRVEYISMFFVGYVIVKKHPQYLQFFMKLFFLVVFISFLYGLGQKYFNFPIIVTQNEEYSKGVALRYVEGSHINSTFAGHYDLATYLVFVLPLILAINVYFKKWNIFYLLTYFAGLWLLVNTASRISLVSYVVAASVALILLKRFKRGFILIFASILFIGFSSNLISRYERVIEIFSATVKKYAQVVVVPPVYAQDVSALRRDTATPTPTPIPVFEDRSTSIRLNVEWPRAIRAFLKNPLLGTGYSSITLATDNDYLRLLGETGLLGVSSFFLILSYLATPFLRYFRSSGNSEDYERIFLASFVGGFLGILINAFFIDVFEASKFAITLWLIFGMLYSVAEKYER